MTQPSTTPRPGGQPPRVTPRHGRESRHPEVAWSELAHRVLDRIRLGAVSIDPAAGLTILIVGLPVPAGCDTSRAVSSLLVAGHAVMADDLDAAGNTPVLLTPLGCGTWERWEHEHPGGAL